MAVVSSISAASKPRPLRAKQAADLFFVRHGHYPAWFTTANANKNKNKPGNQNPNLSPKPTAGPPRTGPPRSAPVPVVSTLPPARPAGNSKKEADQFFIFNGYYPSWYTEQQQSKIENDPFFNSDSGYKTPVKNQGSTKIPIDPFFNSNSNSGGYKNQGSPIKIPIDPFFYPNKNDGPSGSIAQDPFFNQNDGHDSYPNPIPARRPAKRPQIKINDDTFFSNQDDYPSIDYPRNNQKEKTQIADDPFFNDNNEDQDHHDDGYDPYEQNSPVPITFFAGQRTKSEKTFNRPSPYQPTGYRPNRPQSGKTNVADDPFFNRPSSYQQPGGYNKNNQPTTTKIEEDPFFSDSDSDSIQEPYRQPNSQVRPQFSAGQRPRKGKAPITGDPFFNRNNGNRQPYSRSNNKPKTTIADDPFFSENQGYQSSAGGQEKTQIANDPFFNPNNRKDKQTAGQSSDRKSQTKWVVVVQ